MLYVDALDHVLAHIMVLGVYRVNIWKNIIKIIILKKMSFSYHRGFETIV